MAEEEPEFQIAPMIDVLLVLLVFFMSISTTEILQTVEGIELPIAEDALQPPENRPKQQVINVKWEGDPPSGVILLGGLETRWIEDPEDIESILSERFQAHKDAGGLPEEFQVLIRADRVVQYDYIRKIMVAASSAGIQKVTFSVVDKEGTSF